MKNLIFRIVVFSVFATFLSACDKDESGKKIKYYKHVTGEGYVFYKFFDGTIIPFKNAEIRILASTTPDYGGMTSDGFGSRQEVKTDDNGKYSCRFVKQIGINIIGIRHEPEYYFFELIHYYNSYLFDEYRLFIELESILPIIKKASLRHPQLIHIDTIWLEQQHTMKNEDSVYFQLIK
jgi:hypothetical protein